MKIDLVGGSYQQKYTAYNASRCINWYPVTSTQTEKNKSPTALFPYPGLTLFTLLAGRYNRGIFTARTHNYPSRSFAVVDNILYEILPNMTSIVRGTMLNLGIGSTKIYMTCDQNDEVGIFGYQASYVFNMQTNTLTQITSAQFPGLISYATFVDGYTVVVSNGAVYYNLNNNLQGGWLLTQTFSPTMTNAPVIAALVLREEIYCFTSLATEIYYNNGTPYTRMPRSTILIGLLAKDSICVVNDGFVFLGKNEKGETNVFVFDGYYTCTLTSPFSVNWALNNAPPSLDSAHAIIQYTKDGHILYHLTVPGVGTYVYDLLTQMWSERQSLNPVNNSDGTTTILPFRGIHLTNFAGYNLLADSESGAIFKEDYANQTENGITIIRTRISQTFVQDYKNIDVSNFQLDCNTGAGSLSGQGSNPVIQISVSGDGGYNFKNPRNMSLGVQGNHLYRARKRKLGTQRTWVLKMVLSDPIDLMIQNAVAEGTVSAY